MSVTPQAQRFDDAARNYDALLVVSFGGPEGPDDVMPFLDNVLRGLRVKPETRERIAARYAPFGGVSPINEETRAFVAALRNELDRRGPTLPIYWGNRNWHPFLADAFKQMADDGVERAIAYVTSAFSSYSGCRKYREDLYRAAAAVPHPPVIDRLRMPFNHPGFIEAVADRAAEALARFAPEHRAGTPILFTAHSLPESMAANCAYEAQLESSCRLVGDRLEHQRWRLVYQSNNASYGREHWLGPDIGEALEAVAAAGGERAAVVPIGFVCDHLEIVLDLDVEAAGRARELRIEMSRAGTVGTHPAYVAAIRDLVIERMTASPARPALGTLGPSHDICPVDCCLSGRTGPPLPALCGADSPAPEAGAR
jgi:protoporphyrin/coproporphyrin ferrochelatase